MEKGYHTMSSLLLLFVIYFFLVDNQKKMVGAEDAYIEISAIVDQATLENAVDTSEKEFKKIQDTVLEYRKNIGVLTKSSDVRVSLTNLQFLQIKLDSLQYYVTFVSEKSIFIRHHIPKVHFDPIRERVSDLKAWIPSEQGDLTVLIHSYRCRYQRKSVQENLRTAEAAYFARVKEAGIIHLTCTEFSESCISSYTSIMTNLDQYNKTDIKPLKDQLANLQSTCEKPVDLISKNVEILEQRVQGLLATVLLKLKSLVERKMSQLKGASKHQCHQLNLMRLESKDNQNNPKELESIQNRMESIGNDSRSTHDEFEHVFSHLNILIRSKKNEQLFEQCLGESTELRHTIIGFQMLVNEFVDDVSKRTRVSSFQNQYNEFQKHLDLFGKSFEENLIRLKYVPLNEMCSKVNNFNTVFGSELQEQLNQLQQNLKSLESMSLLLTDCEDDYTTIQSELVNSRKSFDVYLYNNHPYSGFLEVFNTQYCTL